jgi:hypothetical protein
MAHDRDHDHHQPEPVPREPALESTDCPDRKRPEHPTSVPRSPVDPRVHPSRRIYARASARPC